MFNLLLKEVKLCASPLSYFFLIFGLMFFIPNYPILCGAFFISLGIFQSFRNTRESNDITFSMLLPIAKSEIVKSKYVFVALIEILGIIIITISTIIRMTVLADVQIYKTNALMNPNFFAIGLVYIIFGLFNLVFVNGFFKTAYNYGKPFVYHTIITFLLIGLSESLHFIPGLESLNTISFDNFDIQLLYLCIGLIIYLLLTQISYKLSCKYFERIDL